MGDPTDWKRGRQEARTGSVTREKRMRQTSFFSADEVELCNELSTSSR